MEASFAAVSAKAAFATLEASFAAVSAKAAFTTLEASLAAVSSETAFTALESSFTAVSAKAAFTALEASLAAVSSETAFTTLEASLAAVSAKSSFTALESSFAAVSSEAAFTALESSFAAVSSETSFTTLEASLTAIATETAFAASTETIFPAFAGTESGIIPKVFPVLDFILVLRIRKAGFHFRSRFIRIPSLKIFRIKYITFIGIIVFPALFALGGSPGDKLGSAQVLALAGRILQQQGYVRIIQESPASGFQIAPPQGTDAHAYQLADAEAQALEHLAHLALQPLFQNNTGAARGSAADVLGLGIAFRNADSAQELHQHGIVKILIYRHPVFLFNPAGGVGKGLGQFPLVRHDQEAFGIGIQPSHVIQMAQARRQQVVNSAYGPLGFTAAYVPARLVQQHHNLLHGSHVTAVHLHEILLRHPHSGRINNLPVHFHASFLNQSVSHPAGINAAGCKEFINADTSVFFGAMLFFTHIGIMSAISADGFVLFVLRQFTRPKKRESLLCRKKKASRFIDIREASCIRKMTCRA